MLGDQRVQPGDPVQAFGQPRPGQPTPVLVDELDVVVVLGPVVPDEQHHTLPARPRLRIGSVEETQRSNGQVLTAPRRGTSSHQLSSLLTTSGRTVCRKTSQVQMSRVLTRQPLPEPSLPEPTGSH